MEPIRLVVRPRHATHATHGDRHRAGHEAPTPAVQDAAANPSVGFTGNIAAEPTATEDPIGEPDSPTSGAALRRTLPERRLAAIGAWCLLEQFGDPTTSPALLDAPAYPEVGLMSVTWPIEGRIRRRDSTGSDVFVSHGHVCLGTAGSGVTVAETGAVDARAGRHARRFLHGVRLAAALPAAVRARAPEVQEIDSPPLVSSPTMRATVLVGRLDGPYATAVSPARVHTPLVAADLRLTTGTERLPLEARYEHGVLLLDGQVSVDGTPLSVGELAYLPVGRRHVDLATLPGCQLLLLGGTPFEEEFILWWNIVAATHEEVVAARNAWERGDPRFGQVPGGGNRATAPPIPPVRLRPRRGSLRRRR